MIKWKQRLYAFLLRRVLGPLLDVPSQEKLHNCIEISLQEGTFTLNNVGLSTSYLNSQDSVQKAAMCIQKARIESISIQLSLVEGPRNDGEPASSSSSLAWRAMNLGTSVALLAQVEIDGIQLEVEPLTRPQYHGSSTSSSSTRSSSIEESDNSQSLAPTNTSSRVEEAEVEESAPRSYLSSYIEAALASLQLTLNLTNFSVRLCQPNSALQDGGTTWIEVKLPSLSYQDLDSGSSSSSTISASPEQQDVSSGKPILEKSILFQGITIAVGEEIPQVDEGSDDSSTSSGSSHGFLRRSPNLVSVICYAEGTGHVALRAVEYTYGNQEGTSSNKKKKKPPRVQQDVDVRLNQQIKISVDETAFLQLQALTDGFAYQVENGGDSNSSAASHEKVQESLLEDSACSPVSDATLYEGGVSRRDEIELYTISGMIKQYNEAKRLAEQNQMRGGMLLPSNAYEEGEHVGEGDSNTFDCFFDANDKSFHHYSSVMKSSIMSSQAAELGSNFVHTKLRFHLLGGGVKLSFRNRRMETEPFHGSDEYILLKFNDVNLTSSVSGKRAEYALQIAHLDIDDAHVPSKKVNSVDDRRVVIESLLSFEDDFQDQDICDCEDVLAQSACISMHVNIDSDLEEGPKLCDMEITMKPLELAFRPVTAAHIKALATSLTRRNTGQHRESSDGSGEIQDAVDSKLRINSIYCTVASVTVSFPVLVQSDFSSIYHRCGYFVNGQASSWPALGITLDNFSIEHRRRDDGPRHTSERLEMTTCFDCHSIICFASSPRSSESPSDRRSQRIDFFAATGRCEVDPYIPIGIEYRSVSQECMSDSNFGKNTFPTVPAFSSFKARQEDEDEDAKIDRILSEKLRDVDVSGRRALRTKDPQNEMLEEAGKCGAVVMIHIPEVILDISKGELEGLVNMLHCIVPDKKNGTEPSESGSIGSDPLPSHRSLAISVACDVISLSSHNQTSPREQPSWNSHVLRLDRCRAHTIIGVSSVRFVRFLSHEFTMFEVSNLENRAPTKIPCDAQSKCAVLRSRIVTTNNSSATPIFYRSKLFQALSHGSPSLLLDFVQPKRPNDDNCLGDKEQSIFLSIYNMTYRYDPGSDWLNNLLSTFKDLKLKSSDDATSESNQTPSNITTLTRLYFSVADCNFDYTSMRQFKTSSRSILRFGDLRLSSNIMRPVAANQAFSLSIEDVSWYLSNTRCPYNVENSLIPGSELMLSPRELSHKLPERVESAPGSHTEVVFREMGFKTILTLESVDAILANTNQKQNYAKEPALTISLTLGELSLYTCKDSFKCFTDTIGDLQTKMTALTNDDIDELSKVTPKQTIESSPALEQNYQDRIEMIPVDATADFNLDGYDWTTIDHDFNAAAEIPPGQEQTARWYNSTPSVSLESSDLIDDGGVDSHISSGPRIVHQHFSLHVVSDPMCGGDMDAPKFAGTNKIFAKTRVLLHDMKLKVRLFDGYDWPEYQTKRKPKPKALFVIDELMPGADDAKTSEGKPPSVITASKKAELMGGLLAGADSIHSTTFEDLPLPEERAKNFLTQQELRRLSRRTNSYIQLSVQGISLRLDSYCDSEEHRLKSCLDLALDDLFLAETISSATPVKMIGEWFNETEHPRDSNQGLLMFKMVTWEPVSPLTSDNEIASDECEVALTLAPVRCILDQRAIKFQKAFLRDDDGEQENLAQGWESDLHPVPPPLLRTFRVRPVKMKIDYFPQQIDTAALKNGSVVELINLSPLDSMVLMLHSVEIEHSIGFGEAMGSLVSHWLGDICATQMHKFLTNARPFEPFTSVTGGVADLLVLPWDAYKNGENVSRALRSSVKSFVGTVANETLTTSSRLAAFIAGEMAKASSSPSLPSSSSSANTSLPSRPLGAPRHVGDAAGHALESLARGLQTANYKILIVPYREYRRSGTRGAVKSIVRGIPIAIAAPVGGASEALSYTLLGARNQFRPDIRKEEEVTQRGLHYGGK